MTTTDPLSLAQVKRLAPATETVLLRATRPADLETPIGAFLRLDDGYPAYLLESVVKPNARIAPGFDTIVVTLREGGTVAGIVAEENERVLSLRTPENKLVHVAKADIARREGAPSSMPEIYHTILTKSELRDVVEYLASLKEKPTTLDLNQPRALRGPPAPQAIAGN